MPSATVNHLTAVWPLHAPLTRSQHHSIGPRSHRLGSSDVSESCSAEHPNDFELAVFSLLWSEHCGYKHSAPLLKRLPSSGRRVLQGPGENAGVLDLGDGLAVAFKVESHNHPSAVEPFQGAATGVGGILRDIVAMGARPVALLDGLRFGEPDWHFWPRRRGDRPLRQLRRRPERRRARPSSTRRTPPTCLVNAMCVGLLEHRARCARRRRPATARVVLYGAHTGRDGIGGASVLASRISSENDTDKRPSVQVGDPFTRQEADRGLAGARRARASWSRCRTAAPPGSPPRSPRWRATAPASTSSSTRCRCARTGMEPWEIMISESQERMVAVVAARDCSPRSAWCATAGSCRAR